MRSGSGSTRRARALVDDLRQRERQLAQARAGHRGDLVDGQAAGLQLRPDDVGQVLALGDVGLVQHDQARPVGQLAVDAPLALVAGGLVGAQFGLDDVEVGDRVAVALQGGAVQDVHQHRAALDVPQELVAQALALGGAGDQAGHVGDGVDRLARADHAEVRDQGGERVVGDLRLGRGHRRDQRGLAGAGVADQGHVGDRLQLQGELAVLAGLAEQREAGGLALGGGQRGVAQAADAAVRDDEAGAGADQVGDHLAGGVLDHGAARAPAAPGRRRWRRSGSRRRRACRCRPCGAARSGSPAASWCSGPPPARCRRRGRRWRRRGRRAA